MTAVSKPLMARNLANAWKEDFGSYVRSLREDRGLTQSDLGDLTDLANKQMISLIETGKTHIPPDRVADFARALKVDPKEFAKRTLRVQNPWVYAELFGADAPLKRDLAAVSTRINKSTGLRRRG